MQKSTNYTYNFFNLFISTYWKILVKAPKWVTNKIQIREGCSSYFCIFNPYIIVRILSYNSIVVARHDLKSIETYLIKSYDNFGVHGEGSRHVRGKDLIEERSVLS